MESPVGGTDHTYHQSAASPHHFRAPDSSTSCAQGWLMGENLSPTSSSRPPSHLAAPPDSQPPTPFRPHFSTPEHTRHSTSTKVSPFQQYGTYVFLSSRISISQIHNQALSSSKREGKKMREEKKRSPYSQSYPLSAIYGFNTASTRPVRSAYTCSSFSGSRMWI